MPTTRPRHVVTETDELAAALDAATTRWPDLTRPQLLVRLALESSQAVRHASNARRAQQLAAIARHSGAVTGAYTGDYLETLRRDWPE